MSDSTWKDEDSTWKDEDSMCVGKYWSFKSEEHGEDGVVKGRIDDEDATHFTCGGKRYNKHYVDHLRQFNWVQTLMDESADIPVNEPSKGTLHYNGGTCTYKKTNSNIVVRDVEWSLNSYENALLWIAIVMHLKRTNTFTNIIYKHEGSKQVPDFVGRSFPYDIESVKTQRAIEKRNVKPLPKMPNYMAPFTTPIQKFNFADCACIGYVHDNGIYTDVYIDGFYEANGALTVDLNRLYEYAPFAVNLYQFRMQNPPVHNVRPLYSTHGSGRYTFQCDSKSWMGQLAYADDDTFYFMYVFYRHEDYEPFTNYRTIPILKSAVTELRPIVSSIKYNDRLNSVVMQQSMQLSISKSTSELLSQPEPAYDIIIFISAHGYVRDNNIIARDKIISIVRFSDFGFQSLMVDGDRIIGTVHPVITSKNPMLHAFNAIQAGKHSITGPYYVFHTDVSNKAQLAVDAPVLYDIDYTLVNHSHPSSDDLSKSEEETKPYFMGVYVLHDTTTRYDVGYKLEFPEQTTLSFIIRSLVRQGYDKIGIIDTACNSYDTKKRRTGVFGVTKKKK
jgi:hypothetical protein